MSERPEITNERESSYLYSAVDEAGNPSPLFLSSGLRSKEHILPGRTSNLHRQRNIIIAVAPYGESKELYHYKDWQNIFRANGIQFKIVNAFSDSIFKNLSDCDGFIWHISPGEKEHARRIIHIIENYCDIAVFPSSKTLAHYQDKIFQNYLFSVLDIPAPNTEIAFSQRDAITMLQNAKFPFVFKLITGSQSANVSLINNHHEAHRIMLRMFNEGIIHIDRDKSKLKNFLYKLYKFQKNDVQEWQKGYFYSQEFLEGNAFDTRVTMIGQRAFAARRFNRENDFRASGSQKIDCDPANIDFKIIEKSFEIHEKIGAQAVAFDFLYKKKKPVLVELSFRFGPLSVKNCPGHWRRESTGGPGKIAWVDGTVNPGFAILQDFIEEVRHKKAAFEGAF